MSWLEYLNLRTYADLARVRADLRKLGQTQPLDQALSYYRTYRPEIVAFVRRQNTPKFQIVQTDIDTDMARLLLRKGDPEAAEEAKDILLDVAEFRAEWLRKADHPTLWLHQAECYHMISQCAYLLGDILRAQTYCSLCHEACREIAKHQPGPMILDEQLDMLCTMYRNMDKLFSDAEETCKIVQGLQARVRLQRCLRWRALREARDRELGLAKELEKLGMEYANGITRYQWDRARECYSKAIAITRCHLKEVYGRGLVELWLDLGDVWESYGDEKSLLKAKDCYVKGLDAAKWWLGKCIRTESYEVPARVLLQECYEYLAEVCEKLPGEKNARKAEKYRRLAESVDGTGGSD